MKQKLQKMVDTRLANRNRLAYEHMQAMRSGEDESEIEGDIDRLDQEINSIQEVMELEDLPPTITPRDEFRDIIDNPAPVPQFPKPPENPWTPKPTYPGPEPVWCGPYKHPSFGSSGVIDRAFKK